MIISRKAKMGVSALSVALLLPTNNTIALNVPTQSELTDIPIFVGKMAFNEGKNKGFDGQQFVIWNTNDLNISINGTFSGDFQTHYSGPPVPYPVILDVLFVQVQGEYVFEGLGDFSLEPLCDVIPVLADASTIETVRFRVAGTFNVTDIMRDRSGLLLRKIWLTLTWVRVYESPDALGFHIFAGDADRYFPDIPQSGFDQEPEPLTGRFGYYQVLWGRGKKHNVYDYQKWIRRFLRG